MADTVKIETWGLPYYAEWLTDYDYRGCDFGETIPAFRRLYPDLCGRLEYMYDVKMIGDDI